MRSYPRNSPEAAARIVALVLICDGHVCRSEIDTLHRLQVEQELGMSDGAFAQVMHALCEDLLAGAYGGASSMCSVDEHSLAALMAEIDEPELRRRVQRLARAAAGADRHLADSEALVLASARKAWGGEAGEVDAPGEPQAALQAA